MVLFKMFYAVFGVVFASFFYAPYSAFGYACSFCFWNINYALWLIVVTGAAVSLSFIRKKHVWYIIFLLYLVVTMVIASAIWGHVEQFFQIIASLVVSSLAFVFYLIYLSDNKRKTFFINYTLLIFVVSNIVFMFLHELSNYRLYSGVAELNSAFVGGFSAFLVLVVGNKLLYEVDNKIGGLLVLYIVAFPILFSVIVLTQSRLALISLIGAVGYGFFSKLFTKPVYREFSSRLVIRRFFVFLALSGFSLWGYYRFAYGIDFNLTRLNALYGVFFASGGDVDLPSATAGRADIWAAGIKAIESPFLGHGFRSFNHEFNVTPHNTYLLMYYENGVLGIAPLVLLVVLLLVLFFVKNKKIHPRMLLVFLLLYSVGNDVLYMPVYMILLAYAVSCLSFDTTKNSASPGQVVSGLK